TPPRVSRGADGRRREPSGRKRGGGEPREGIPALVPRAPGGDPQGENERFSRLPPPPLPEIGDVRRHPVDGGAARLGLYDEVLRAPAQRRPRLRLRPSAGGP